MLRFGYVVIVCSFVAFSLFACGEKLNPKGEAPTGGASAGGTTGEGGTTDIGGMDGGDSEAGVAIDGGGGTLGGSGGTGGSTTATVSYSKTIAPFMAKTCATSTTCHSAGNPWGVDLDTYAAVKAHIAESIGAIQGTIQPPMPPSGTVSASDLKSLQDWVTAGYPN